MNHRTAQLPCLLAVTAMALAPAPVSAGVKRAESRFVATTCADLASAVEARVGGGSEVPGLLFDAPVVRTETDKGMALTFLCGEPGVTAVCLEYQNGGVRVGERVRVEGIVAGTWDKGPVLDPCGTTRQEG